MATVNGVGGDEPRSVVRERVIQGRGRTRGARERTRGLRGDVQSLQGVEGQLGMQEVEAGGGVRCACGRHASASRQRLTAGEGVCGGGLGQNGSWAGSTAGERQVSFSLFLFFFLFSIYFALF